jgi:hypothetical protein
MLFLISQLSVAVGMNEYLKRCVSLVPVPVLDHLDVPLPPELILFEDDMPSLAI